jgi:opacity protein-like surface antigen
VIGLRAFVDLTEQWNLRFDGDYGGFGVDDNHETWNLRGLAGYRFRGWGVGWNIQAGYRVSSVRGVCHFAYVGGTCIGEVRANPIQDSARDKDKENPSS